ncbi:MAG: YciI family protein [Candidatus Thorarchaeota archaeon]
MKEKQHFYAIIKPYRQDFITNPKEKENNIMSEHFIYLKSLLKQKKLILAGPTLIPDDPFGLIILEVNTEEEAKDLLENDPSVKAKIQNVVDLRPIRISLIKE